MSDRTHTAESLPYERVIPPTQEQVQEWIRVLPHLPSKSAHVFVKPRSAVDQHLRSTTLVVRMQGIVDYACLKLNGNWDGYVSSLSCMTMLIT